MANCVCVVGERMGEKPEGAWRWWRRRRWRSRAAWRRAGAGSPSPGSWRPRAPRGRTRSWSPGSPAPSSPPLPPWHTRLAGGDLASSGPAPIPSTSPRRREEMACGVVGRCVRDVSCLWLGGGRKESPDAWRVGPNPPTRCCLGLVLSCGFWALCVGCVAFGPLWAQERD